MRRRQAFLGPREEEETSEEGTHFERQGGRERKHHVDQYLLDMVVESIRIYNWKIFNIEEFREISNIE